MRYTDRMVQRDPRHACKAAPDAQSGHKAKPLTAEDLFPLFSEEAARQEMNFTDSWIEIPEEVRDLYKIWRPTPLVRARGLEKRSTHLPASISRTRA